jgi:hypothetical protein
LITKAWKLAPNGRGGIRINVSQNFRYVRAHLLDGSETHCRYSLMRFFLTLGASLIREEGGQVTDSKPVMFGRHGLE